MTTIETLTKAKANARERGFTLVELAIVLVIIGLIIGGVLVGQDLIKAAELRATTSSIEKYNAAANTFRNTYNGIPGDILASRAVNFGLTARAGSAGQGDGNSLLEGCDIRLTALGCETALFWVDLTDAQLLGDAFTVGAGANDGIADGNNVANAITTVDAMARYVPTIALRESAFVHVYTQGGKNFFYMGNFHTNASGEILTVGPQPGPALANHEVDGLAGLTPAEASQLDDKVDDGVPTTGIFRAVAEITDNLGGRVNPGSDYTFTDGATNACVHQGAAAGIGNDEAYNTTNSDFANELNCNIFWRASF